MPHVRLALRPLLLAVGLVAASSGCGSAPVDMTYADSARQAYDEAMEYFEDEDYLEAVKRLTTVKNKYAYSKYAALAEIRVADAYYEQEKWAEAIDAYRTFAQSRPNHPDVPYALWRVGSSYFEQIPSDFFILPPVHERDPAATKDALRALETFAERYPAHERAGDARDRILACRRLLADQELYVARFYVRADRPVSARGRLEGVVAQYTDLPDRWAEAALLLARVYAALSRSIADQAAEFNGKARQTAERLIRDLPAAPESERARDLLAELPAPPPAPPPPPPDPVVPAVVPEPPTAPESASPDAAGPPSAAPPAPAAGG